MKIRIVSGPRKGQVWDVPQAEKVLIDGDYYVVLSDGVSAQHVPTQEYPGLSPLDPK